MSRSPAQVTFSGEMRLCSTRNLLVHHRGAENALSVLRWMQENFQNPEEFLSRDAAQAYGSLMYALLLAKHYEGTSDEDYNWRLRNWHCALSLRPR